MSLIELFESTVKKHPDNVAVVVNEKIHTYNDINELSINIGRAIFQYDWINNSRKDFIAIMTTRDICFVVSILGILKAGFGYIPIDPDQFQTKKRSSAKGLRPFFLFGSKDHHFLAITFGRVEVLATAAVFVFGATGTFLFMGMATVFGSVVVTLKA